MSRFLIFSAIVLGSALSISAQQVKILAPHRHIPELVPESRRQPLPPAKVGSLSGGLWITDANLKSTLYLKNVIETSSITVTPVLYLSNGKKFVLPNITLEPAGTAVVDINSSLRDLGIASYATLSGHVEIDYKWPWVPLCATVRIVDMIHSVIFTYGVPPLPVPGDQNAHKTIAEGLWWKHENNVTGFVALANISSRPIRAAIKVLDDQGTNIDTREVTVSPNGTKVVSLPGLQSTSAKQGGIQVAYDGPSQALDVTGGLEDQDIGYSASVRFAPAPSASEAASEDTTAELGLMAGAADPMMLFPVGTTFTPYSILRNISDGPLLIKPTLWWMQAGSAHSAVIGSFTLLSSQSRTLDIPTLLSTAGLKGFNGSMNLVFDVKANRARFWFKPAAWTRLGLMFSR